jgi:hypothetical protein
VLLSQRIGQRSVATAVRTIEAQTEPLAPVVHGNSELLLASEVAVPIQSS